MAPEVSNEVLLTHIVYIKERVDALHERSDDHRDRLLLVEERVRACEEKKPSSKWGTISGSIGGFVGGFLAGLMGGKASG